MEENTKKCPRCGQVNEAGYAYCNNCGAPLEDDTVRGEIADEPAAFARGETPDPRNGAPYENGGNNGGWGAWGQADRYADDGIDGVSVDELGLFIGKKAPVILQKFIIMERSGSRVSWCWPAAILGFLFGIPGAAIWFFYRKMYKYAFILSAVGAVVTIALGLLGGERIDYSAYFDEAVKNGAAAIEDFITRPAEWRVLTADRIDGVLRIGTAVVAGIFSMDFYKRFAVSNIKDLRRKGGDPRYYRIGISALGGTSGGMVWVGILFILASEILASIISQLTGLI